MWTVVFLMCFTILTQSSSQETPSSQAETQAEHGIEWDDHDGKTVIKIESGTPRNNFKPSVPAVNLPMMYSNQWRPFIMPVSWNTLRNNYGQNVESAYGPNYPYGPVFLRRPDSNQNWTIPFSDYTESPGINRNLVPPFLPASPIAFNPNFVPQDQNVNPKQETTNTAELNSNPEFEIAKSSEIGNTVPPIFTGQITGHFPDDAMHRFFVPPYPPYSPLSSFFVPPYGTPPAVNYRFPNGLQRSIGSDISPKPEVNVSEAMPHKQENVSDNTVLNSDSVELQIFRSLPNIITPQPVGTLPVALLPPPLATPVVPPPVFPKPLQNPDLGPRIPPSYFPAVRNIPQVLPREPEKLPNANPQSNPEEAVVDESKEYPNIDLINKDNNIPKIPYEFGYEMNDGKGTGQHRQEIADGSGVVTGSYGYRDNFGIYRFVNYVADKNGFRAVVKSNEPGVINPGSADVVVEADHPPPPLVSPGISHAPDQSDLVAFAGETEELVAEGSERKAD